MICTPHQILFRTHVEHVAHMGKNTNAYIVLVGKPEGKRMLQRLRYIYKSLILKCVSR